MPWAKDIHPKYRVSPKICDYDAQHAEAGYEEKVKNQKTHIFIHFKSGIFKIFKNVISLISDFLFRFCLSMLCSIVANFGDQSLCILGEHIRINLPLLSASGHIPR